MALSTRRPARTAGFLLPARSRGELPIARRRPPGAHKNRRYDYIVDAYSAALTSIAAATPADSSAKPCCNAAPPTRAPPTRRPTLPASAPAENGSATIHGKCPAAALTTTPDVDTSAITASDVATTDCMLKSV